MNRPLTTSLPDTTERNADARRQAVTLALRWAVPVSPHEGYAKILERLDDLKAEVFHGSRDRARAEAIRVAAATMGLLLDLAEHVGITEVADAVSAELIRAQRRFGLIASPHEGYAVILEEFDELWAEVKRGDRVAMWDEAVQVAAMALRFHVDIPADPPVRHWGGGGPETGDPGEGSA